MRPVGKLSALAVSRASKPGLYSDGGGLYLRVKPDGGKFWVFRFMLDGKAREMGLGAFHTVGLSDARAAAVRCRVIKSEGRDPIDARSEERGRIRSEKAMCVTFKTGAETYIDTHKAVWRNPVHIKQWSSTLATYAYPVFGDLPISEIKVAHIIKALEPIWKKKTETASRLRGRIELVLDWAKARGYRTGENPARWRGHLDNLLPAPGKLKRVRHQPALPYKQIGEFYKKLRKQEGVAAKALRFVILTGSRTNEVLKAKWSEFDLDEKVWVIPADRMKAGRDHRVPLQKEAVEILKQCKGSSTWVFCGRSKVSLSNMSMLVLLKRMGTTDITVHGFRSSFRDWVADQTEYPAEIAEAALAHIKGDKVEAAYQRSDLFDKRRLLMDDWGAYCTCEA